MVWQFHEFYTKKNYRGIFFIAANWITAKIQFGNSPKKQMKKWKATKDKVHFFKTNVRQALSEKKALREHPQLTPDSFLAFFLV